MLRNLRRKWWFWLGLSGSTLALLGVLTLYAEWRITRSRGEARLAEAVAKLDADDPNWRIHDLCAARNAALPPPDENAGERALQAHRLIPKSYQDWLGDQKWLLELQPGVQPYEEDICEAAGVYDDCAEALKVARTVRQLPRGGFKLVYSEPNPLDTLLPHLQPLREVAGLLEFDAVMRAYAGQGNEAIESVHAALNCGRAVGDEPILISQLVRMAIIAVAKSATERTLGLTEPTAGVAELQAALAEELPAPRLTYAYRGERGSAFHVIENIDNGSLGTENLFNDRPGSAGPRGLWERFNIAFLRQYLPDQQATTLEMFNQLLDADMLSGPVRKAAFDAIPPPQRSYENLFAVLFAPAWNKHETAELLARTNIGTTIAALACERYRRKFGHWPASLQAIPKDILPAVPTDPYTDGPLLYHTTDDGAVVYATGPDLTDNVGVLLKQTSEAGTDVGFRLFNPDRRGQAPPRPAPDDLPLLPDGVVVP
jgi:hypothetical protein